MSFANTPMLAELVKLCQGGASGTLFTTLTDGHQLRIGLLRGRIVHVASLSQRGLTALKTLPLRAPRSFRFEAGLSPEPQSDLPPTPAILSLLQEGTRVAPHAATAEGSELDAKTLSIVTEELTEYLGPIADILVEEQRQAASLDILLNRLSAQLDSPEQAQKFAQRVRARLA